MKQRQGKHPTPERIAAQMALEARLSAVRYVAPGECMTCGAKHKDEPDEVWAAEFECGNCFSRRSREMAPWTDERIDRVVTSIARAAADREPRPREWTEGMHDVIDAAVHRALLLVVQAFHVELLKDRPTTPSFVDRSSRGQRETLE